MKTCFNCRTINIDEASNCASCGAELSNGAPTEEKRFLDDCCRNLRHERRALRIVGIVLCVFAAIMMLLLLLMVGGYIGFVNETEPVGLIGVDAADADDILYTEASIFIFGILYFSVYIVMALVIGIVNLISASRTGKAIDAAYTDFSVVVKRNATAKRIVFGAFFNTIAMIFIIINFARLKNNRALCDRIIAKQSAEQSAEQGNFNFN